MEEIAGPLFLLLFILFVIEVVKFFHWVHNHLFVTGVVSLGISGLALLYLKWRHNRRLINEERERFQAEQQESHREEERRKRNALRAEQEKQIALSVGIKEIDAWHSKGLSTHEIGRRFEERMAVHFKLLGAKVNLTKRSGDGGGDLIITWPGGRIGVAQCKCFNPRTNKVGVDAARDALTSMVLNKAHYAMVITNSHLNRRQALPEAKQLWY